MNWRATLLKFQTHLKQEQGLHSVKDLCEGLLHQFGLKTREEVIEYLHDYLAISQYHRDFHSKWKKIPNMRNIADYDQKEIDNVQQLILLLSE